MRGLGGWTLAALAAACASASGPPGTADIHVIETPERTTIIGWSASDGEVARLDLQHGRIVLGPEYRELAGSIARGRHLNVQVLGQTFEWQTAGFTDTLNMPALTPRFAAVAAFVADPRVRAILRRWRIGWQDVERAQCLHSGWNATPYNPHGATNYPLPIQQGNTAACNNSPAWQALVVNQDTQDLVMMCCGATASSGAYAEKSCAAHGTCTAGPNAGASCAPNGVACGAYNLKCFGGSNAGTQCTPTGSECQGGGRCVYCDQVSSCGDALLNKCKPCFTPIPYADHCAVGGREAVHAGQHGTPHDRPGEDHLPARAIFFGCHTHGDECLPNGAACLGEGWGQGDAYECCSGACCNYQCCSRRL